MLLLKGNGIFSFTYWEDTLTLNQWKNNSWVKECCWTEMFAAYLGSNKHVNKEVKRNSNIYPQRGNFLCLFQCNKLPHWVVRMLHVMIPSAIQFCCMANSETYNMKDRITTKNRYAHCSWTLTEKTRYNTFTQCHSMIVVYLLRIKDIFFICVIYHNIHIGYLSMFSHVSLYASRG